MYIIYIIRLVYVQNDNTDKVDFYTDVYVSLKHTNGG